MSSPVQLPLVLTNGTLPIDPVELAKLPALERAKLYDQLGPLDFEQRQACEDPVRAVIRGTFGRRGQGA